MVDYYLRKNDLSLSEKNTGVELPEKTQIA